LLASHPVDQLLQDFHELFELLDVAAQARQLPRMDSNQSNTLSKREWTAPK
jgi:hypothetical protein